MGLMAKGRETVVWNISVGYFDHITIISKTVLVFVRIQTQPLIVYLFAILATL